MQETIFFNGKFLREEARAAETSVASLYALGLFETMRSCNNKIVYLDQHIERIKSSAKLIGIKLIYSPDKLKKIIRETVSLNSVKDARVKLTLWRAGNKSGILVTIEGYRPYPLKKYNTGFSAGISRFRQGENSLLARIKTTSRILYRLSLEEAIRKGFDEALILNNHGFIAEATRSNVFLVKSGDLFTPSLACGCLDGITRRAVLDLARRNNIKAYEGKFTPLDLYAADEVFLTGSLMGLMPVSSLERKKIGQVKCNSLTKFLIRKYSCLLK
ncbi:MAG: aminotransferase class IV [Candidatus Omnitrophica bacterium]|nr:aminotransferase class IV [Candidatus Omnitrophota bacterium]